MAPSPVAHDPMRSARWPGIDAARGTAIAAMVVYHFSWDLSYLGLITTDIVNEPGWQLFARTIAASFLTLVGTGLVLAHQHGGVSWTAFLRRLAIISAAALGVTLVTRFVFPDEYIFFGILHWNAVASALAEFDVAAEPDRFRKIESGRRLWNFSTKEIGIWKEAL